MTEQNSRENIPGSTEMASSLRNDTPSDSYSNAGSLDSDEEVVNNENDTQQYTAVPITGTLSRRILTRTSTIVDGIRDDNNYASHRESMVVPPAPFGSTNPEEDHLSRKLSLGGTKKEHLTKEDTDALDSYDGEFNKQDMIDRPPDGTFWGWLSAVCVCFINTFSWGTNSSFGVFLNYYLKTNHFKGATMEDFALIGGLNLGLSFMLCNIANSLVRRFYYKSVMVVGIVLLVICYLCAAEAKTILQLIMLQGLLLSIAYAFAAGPCFVIIPTWFLKRRSIANGIATSGAGLAGIVFSRPTQALINKTGSYKWALRMIGIVCGVMLSISTMLIRCRRSLIVKADKPFWKELLGNFTRWDVYRQKPVLCLVSWNFLYGISYTILLFSMSSYATDIGLTYEQGSMVTTVQSIAQFIGRPLLGVVSDYFGKVNVTIIITVLLGVLSMVYWIFVHSYASLIVFAFISGIMVGVNWVNFTPLCADVVGGGDDLLAAVSFLCLIGGPPMIVAEIIGLKLRRDGSSKPFLYCQILVGVAALVSAAFLMIFREWKIYRMLDARRTLIQKKVEDKRNVDDIARLSRYDFLLRKSVISYFTRMFYPIKA